jgi:hypothetical protein
MVSIITRSEFIRHFESDEYTTALVDFLLGKALSKNNNVSTSNANEISKQAFYALQNNDKALFSELYQEIARRKPNPESEWLHNDVLLFILTLGVKNFDLNKKWLDEVLNLRIEHSQDESKLITQTYIDILKGNLENNSNHQPLMIVLKYFLGFSLGDEDYVNSIYKELTQNLFPYSKAAFVNLINLKALDVIVLSKGLIDLDRQKDIEGFIVHFNNRITQFATAIWWAVIILIAVASIGFALFYLRSNSQQAEIIDRILTILPFFGIGSLFFPIKYKKGMVNFFKKPFFWYYGYKVKQDI